MRRMRARPLLDLLTAPWAIVPEKLLDIQAIYAAHLRGERSDIAAIEAAAGKQLENDPQGYTVEDGVAVVPLVGVIAKRANLFQQISGGASHQLFARDMRAALADPNVSAILVEIDSPGGTADGTQLAAQAVAAARGVKPVAALADGTMASAAYWIGAWADEVFAVDTTTQLGSIGVVATHVDVSRAEQMLGRKTTEIVAGQYKRIASAYAPLSEAGRASLQQTVDDLYGIFVQQVADARNRSVETVLASMADGRMFMGQQAVAAGLADGVASRDDILNALRKRAQRGDRSYFNPYPQNTPVRHPPRGQKTAALLTGSISAAQIAAARKDSPMADSTMTVNVEVTPATIAGAFTAEHPAAAAVLRAEGAAAERQRIADVRAQSLSGHEALIERLAMDGKTTGPEAAVAVLNAERAASAARQADIAHDAPAPLPGANSGDGDTPAPARKPGGTNAERQANAHRLAHAIAAKQAEARAAGRTLSAPQALALVNQEQGNA